MTQSGPSIRARLEFMSINRKQKKFIYGGVACGIAVATLIGFFPEAINTNPVLRAVTFLLIIPASIVSFWLLTEILKG